MDSNDYKSPTSPTIERVKRNATSLFGPELKHIKGGWHSKFVLEIRSTQSSRRSSSASRRFSELPCPKSTLTISSTWFSFCPGFWVAS